jgi:hypothetical protein
VATDAMAAGAVRVGAGKPAAERKAKLLALDSSGRADLNRRIAADQWVA